MSSPPRQLGNTFGIKQPGIHSDPYVDRSSCVAFSPDGKSLVASRGAGIVHLWDLATGKELAAFKGHTER